MCVDGRGAAAGVAAVAGVPFGSTRSAAIAGAGATVGIAVGSGGVDGETLSAVPAVGSSGGELSCPRYAATRKAVAASAKTNTPPQIAAVCGVMSGLSGGPDAGPLMGGLVHALRAAELNDGPLGCGGGTEATSAGPRIAMRSSDGVATGPA